MIPNRRGSGVIRHIGVQHRPDDVARVQVPPGSLSGQAVVPITTPQGPLVASPAGSDVYFTLNTCYRTMAYRNQIGVAAETITWDDVSCAIEVINDSVNNIGVAFGGAGATVPSYSSILTSTNALRSREIRFFPIHVKTLSIIADAASSAVRVTIFLPS